MGRRRDGNSPPPKNNSIQNLVGKEYPVHNLNKTTINITKELSNAHRKNLKEEIWEDIFEKFMEKILDMVNHNVQDALKKFQDTKNKKQKKTQKQIKELKEDFNEHQSETKDTIKRDIYELKRTTQNTKEELITDLENLRRMTHKSWKLKIACSQTKNLVKGQSSTLQQMEDRISEFEDKIESKEKNRKSVS
jgi:hypothetical protein